MVPASPSFPDRSVPHRPAPARRYGRVPCKLPLIALASLAATFAGAPATRAVTQEDLAAVRGDVTRDFLGRGRGVTVGVLDGGIDIRHPALSGSVLASRDFSNSGTFDDDPTGPGHATGIAGLYAAHAADFIGLAPKAGILNARVIDADDSTADRWAGNGLFYSLNRGAKVINLSFGNDLSFGPLTPTFNLMADYAAEHYGASLVAAAGNESASAVPQAPAGAYNLWSVGGLASNGGNYDRVASFSNLALPGDRRSKPELVAPGQFVQRPAANWETASEYANGTGTSFATGIVGGILAQMVGYGQDFGLPTDPMLLKAITLASADHVADSDGAAWNPRRLIRQRNSRRLYTRPLDDQQGAGRIDAFSAYRIYSRTNDSSHAQTDWIEDRMRRGSLYRMDLGRLRKGQRIDAALTWLHHVGRRDDGDGVPDVDDRYFEAAELARFALYILRDDRIMSISYNPFDNLAYLSYLVGVDANYKIQVERLTEGGTSREPFALAMRVLNNPSAFSASADATAFALPAEPTGQPGVRRSLDDPVPVPEPSTALVSLLALVPLTRRRRR